MRHDRRFPTQPAFAALALALAAGGVEASDDAKTESAPLVKLERTIPLPGVEGRIDHMVVSADGKRLFVAALEHGSVEVVDLPAGHVVRPIRPLPEPQGVAILPKTGRLAVACGGDGSVRIHDATTLEPVAKVALGEDADNTRVDVGTGRLVVGYGAGGLAIVDEGAVMARIALAGHPESFQLEESGTRVFVNVPPSRHVAVADRTTGKVVATWDLEVAGANYPMALDEGRHRLFVGCRKPAKLLVLDTTTGKTVAHLDVVGDVDDVWYDADTRRIYATGGEGAIDVIEQTDADRYRTLSRTKTAGGARTSLFLRAQRLLYVAVPHRGEQPAEIRVYSIAR